MEYDHNDRPFSVVVFNTRPKLFYADNERIFGEVVENSQRKKKPFVHHEEKFDAVNQSVVVFCLTDFYRNKK